MCMTLRNPLYDFQTREEECKCVPMGFAGDPVMIHSKNTLVGGEWGSKEWSWVSEF